MKQPKKPTYNQKRIIASVGLDVKKWAVRYEDKTTLIIVNKETGTDKVINK